MRTWRPPRSTCGPTRRRSWPVSASTISVERLPLQHCRPPATAPRSWRRFSEEAPVPPEQATPGSIDVYTDTVPGARQRTRGLRSQAVSVGADDFRTPVLDTPIIERPTVWPETEANRDQVMEQAEALEPVDNREMRRRLAGIEM